MKDSILLLEESNYGLRGRLVSTLTRGGFEVGSVASCQEALSKLAEIKPRLIIVGEGLPIDSFEACSNLRLAIDVPILVMGIVPTDKAWTRLLEVGGDFYLLKPFSHLELVARVKALLRRYELTKSRTGREAADNAKV